MTKAPVSSTSSPFDCNSFFKDSAESTRTPLRQIVAEEIDLEIALRERLVETIESKITWALLLQEQLDKSSYGMHFISLLDKKTS